MVDDEEQPTYIAFSLRDTTPHAAPVCDNHVGESYLPRCYACDELQPQGDSPMTMGQERSGAIT